MSVQSVPTGGGETPRETASPRRELILGGVIIALFFGLFMGWAALAPLDSGAYASGQISVTGNRQAVQHREGGTVSALHVAEGDTVRQGQTLIELTTGELTAAERGLSGQVYALLAQRSRLIAERDKAGSVPVPPEFSTLSPEDRALADEALRLQRLQFGARGAGRTTEVGVLRQRIGQLEERILGYRRQIEANEEQRRLIGEELEGLRSLVEQGFAPLNRVRALERTAAGLDGEQGSLRAQIASTREQVGETRLQMLSVTTGMNEDVSDQLRQIEVQLNETQPRLAALRDQIERSHIRSPATGQVVGLTVFTEGGVVQAGQTLMEIVPRTADQIIVARIDPADIDSVRVGLDSEIRFPGLRERDPPIIHGRIARLSADTFTDEASGRSYYRAEISIPPDQMATLGSAATELRPGVPVEVVIVLRQRTALSYLVEPLTRNLWRSGAER
ncbi:MAG: HlyD family type I secretion periplasmic adaptor subunit [Alphaproteobacteria bacterium]|nr:HlyD family type I secretion periplasmic adaptor subunit [Alphaproteobacteria bacterium]MBU2379020.1 HlyD family type I secretion periplasmic adaptor subunit [Alphaproteobacteria bacterium]